MTYNKMTLSLMLATTLVFCRNIVYVISTFGRRSRSSIPMDMVLLLLLSVLLLCGEAVSPGHQNLDHIFNSAGTEVSQEIKSSSTYDTSPDDIDGLKALANQFPVLQLSLDFGDDPCGESARYYWAWIECSTTTPPRITALKLANNLLYGELPDFSQMQALETIDFANNMLYGQIPSFLGQFPKLKRLDLSNNRFRGSIPRSILDKKNLTYNVEGNPNAYRPKKKNLGLLIGLPVGLIVGLVLPGLLIFLLTRRKPVPRPSQVIIGTVSVNNIENGSSQGISQEKLNNPPPSSSSQGFDQVEVNELLQLHNHMNNSRRG